MENPTACDFPLRLRNHDVHRRPLSAGASHPRHPRGWQRTTIHHETHHPRRRRRRRLPPVELQLPQLRRRAQRQRPCPAAHPVVDLRGRRRQRRLGPARTPRPTSCSRSRPPPELQPARRLRDTGIGGILLVDGQIGPRHRPLHAARAEAPMALWSPTRSMKPHQPATRCSTCSATTLRGEPPPGAAGRRALRDAGRAGSTSRRCRCRARPPPTRRTGRPR